MFTRQQIEAITIGTQIAAGFDGRFGEFQPVTSIHAMHADINGKLFVCGYRRHGDNAQISFSIKEGDACDFRHYRIAA